MSKQNIIQVKNLIDLKTVMGSCVTVVAGFTTPETDHDLKLFIRRFLKRKAERFPLITFVYMEVSDQDRNTLNILKGTVEDYPKMFHIRDGNKFIIAVNAATEETITESFKQVEGYYVKEMKEFQQRVQNSKKSNIKEDSDERIDSQDDAVINEDDDQDQDNDQDEDADDQEEDRNNKQKSKNSSSSGKGSKTGGKSGPVNGAKPGQKNGQLAGPTTGQMAVPTQEPQLDPLIEKKKNLEKLVMLNKKSDDIKLEVVKEIAKRKKMESVIEKKKSAETKDDNGKEYRKSLRKTAK